jgi:hypothetical protein
MLQNCKVTRAAVINSLSALLSEVMRVVVKLSIAKTNVLSIEKTNVINSLFGPVTIMYRQELFTAEPLRIGNRKHGFVYLPQRDFPEVRIIFRTALEM